MEKEKVKKDTWEVKDRYYNLKSSRSPLTYRVNSRHSARKPLLYFDELKGHNRELRYATNMKSPFVDEQEGTATLGHIVFTDGVLHVPKTDQALQKLLSLYHPNRDKLYIERDDQKEAVNEMDYIDMQLDGMNIARDIDIEQSESDSISILLSTPLTSPQAFIT